MKALLSVGILFAHLVVPSTAHAQNNPHRHWIQVLATEGETLDMDTVAVGRSDGSFIVWLRWNLDRQRPQWGVEYRVEQVEVDCRGLRERVLSAARVGPGNSMRSSSIPLDSIDMSWRRYSKGSLGAQSVRELCRRLTSA